MADLGTYKATLTADQSGLQAGLDKAQKSLSGFSTQLTSSVSFLAAGPIGAIVAGIKTAVDAVKNFANGLQEAGDKAEKLLNAADAFGVSVEKFQVLSGAAKLAGVEIGTVEKALKGIGQLVTDVANNDAGTISKLTSLGIDPQQFVNMNATEALDALSKAIGKIENPLERVGTAMQLHLGKDAVAVAQILKLNLAEVEQQMKQLGAIQPGKSLEGLDQTADELTKAGMAWDGLKNRLWNGSSGIGGFLGMIGQRTFGGANRMFDELSKEGAGPAYGTLKQAEEIAKAKEKAKPMFGPAIPTSEQWEVMKQGEIVYKLQMQNDKLAATMGGAGNQADLYSQKLAGLSGKMLEAVEAQMKMNDALTAAKAAIPKDDIQQWQQILTGLNAGVAAGGISERDRNRAIFQQGKGLVDAAGLGGSHRLPGALIKGSIEDYRDNMRQKADGKDSPAKQVLQAIESVKKQLEMENKIGEAILRAVQGQKDKPPIELEEMK